MQIIDRFDKGRGKVRRRIPDSRAVFKYGSNESFV